MIELKTINYLTIQECRELARVNDIDDFFFTKMEENGSYVYFDCSENNVQKLEDEALYFLDADRMKEYKQVRHDIRLAEMIHELYNLDEILVLISW